MKPLLERYVLMPSGCWQWTGYVNTYGYGVVHVARRPMGAHRFFYTVHRGEIPPGLELDHLCSNRRCVNPSHLEAVTHRENLLRSPNTLAGKQSRRTQCLRGHPLSGSNLYVKRNGQRQCRECRNSKRRVGKPA